MRRLVRLTLLGYTDICQASELEGKKRIAFGVHKPYNGREKPQRKHPGLLTLNLGFFIKRSGEEPG